ACRAVSSRPPELEAPCCIRLPNESRKALLHYMVGEGMVFRALFEGAGDAQADCRRGPGIGTGEARGAPTLADGGQRIGSGGVGAAHDAAIGAGAVLDRLGGAGAGIVVDPLPQIADHVVEAGGV